jgi:hypothetical protein
MARSGPLLTLGSVVALAAILLTVDLRISSTPSEASSSSTGSWATSTASGSATATATAPASTPASVASAPLHALFAGRSSGDEFTVAIAINGAKAAADLNAGLSSQAALQGSVSGGQVTLTSGNGVTITGSATASAVFGLITAFGRTFPFSAEPAVVQAVYTGRSSGNEVTVAVDTQGDKAVAYVCNGKHIEAWLQGSVRGSQVTLTGNKGASLSGSLSGLDMFGTVTPLRGQAFPFAAELSPHPAGVYQARIEVNGLATRIGWAVLPDGTQLGVAAEGAAKLPAPPLDLSDGGFTIDGASFTAALVAGKDTVVSP